MDHIAYPVQLIWDRPNVEPSKRWNLLDQLMPLYSCQPKFNNCGLPTMSLMTEHHNGSLTITPKEAMQTRRKRGVLIEPLEPDDSDEERPPQKRKLHSKYQLRFVNKVCEAYYTRERIRADDGNLLKVALFDENNTKITSGPLSSASVEVVVLHGDFNVDGHDYWTSEEFISRCVACPEPGKEAPVLGGDRILVLADGEACLGDAFFQISSFCARTGTFKMGIMLASAQDEIIQEGISEPFRVRERHAKALPPGFRFHPTDEELIVHYLCQCHSAATAPYSVPITAEVDIYEFDPWDLPAKAVFGEDEWFFLCPQNRRNPVRYWSGMVPLVRPNRATSSGYWKATGSDKPVFRGTKMIGFKKALVFYKGRAPNGVKTSWIMHEYRLADDLPAKTYRPTTNSTKGMRLDEWVLCRIYSKTKQLQLSPSMDDDESNGQPLQEFSSCTDMLPPGFRFHPTDKELIIHYLRNRATSTPCPAPVIAEVDDIYKFQPWDLPAKATYGEHEWYFFCHRNHKYATGIRRSRTTVSGYWKATGKDKPITLSAADDEVLGFRKTLVFYIGRAPRGVKTDWIMHEYGQAISSSTSSTCLKEWLLCRIFRKILPAVRPSPSMDHGGLCQLLEDDSAPYTPTTTLPSSPNIDLVPELYDKLAKKADGGSLY